PAGRGRHRPRRDALLSPRRHPARCRGTGRRPDRRTGRAVRRGAAGAAPARTLRMRRPAILAAGLLAFSGLAALVLTTALPPLPALAQDETVSANRIPTFMGVA